MFRKYPKYKFLLAFCDLAVLVASWLGAILLRFSDRTFSEHLEHPLASVQLALIVAYSLVWVVVFQHFHLYKINLFLSVSSQITAIVKAFIYGLVGLIVLSFFIKGLDWIDSRAATALFVLIAFVSISLFRTVIFRHFFRWASQKKILKNRVVIVGRGPAALMIAAQIDFDDSEGMHVAGFVDDDTHEGERVFEDQYTLGGIDDIAAVVKKHDIDEVIIAKDEIGHDELLDLIDRVKQSRVSVRLISDLYRVVDEKVLLERYTGVPIVRVQQNNESVLFSVYKRIFDFVAAAVTLVILCVPLILIAICIKATSRGPILYKHTRIGKDCRPFEFYKFRTMLAGCDDSSHREFVGKLIAESAELDLSNVKKIVDDPRVTSVGRFLRRTSLDELPQLINVLQGNMSLVGPRPCLPYELERYQSWHRRRLTVTPGCTGLWQVSGRSAVGFNDMVILDLFYIENMSPLFDLRILLRTIPVMVFGRGGH